MKDHSTNPFDEEEDDDSSNNVGYLGLSARKKKSIAKLACALPSSSSGDNSLSRSHSRDESVNSSTGGGSRSSAGSRGGRSGRRRFNNASMLSTSVASSKNSTINPDRLFDSTVDDSSVDKSKLPTTSQMVNLDSSSGLLKDASGAYVIDTMSSF